MTRKKKIWLTIIIILAVGGGVYYYSTKNKNTAVYTTEEARVGTLVETVSVTGTLKSQNQADLSFEASGLVKNIYVKVGDSVKRGQLLAKLDPKVYAAQARSAQEDVRIQQEALDLQRRNWDDLKPEEKASYKATVRKYEALRQAAGDSLRKTYLYAPVAGTVTAVDVDAGENVTANQAIITVMDLKTEEILIESNVPEADITKMKIGQKAKITFDALTLKDIFEGEVSEIYPASNVIQDVVFYKVKIKLSKIDERLKPGMSCDIDVNIFQKDNVMIIPSRAIKSENGKSFVEVLKKDDSNTTEKKYVELGAEGDDGLTEVKSGLVSGDKVVTFVKK